MHGTRFIHYIHISAVWECTGYPVCLAPSERSEKWAAPHYFPMSTRSFCRLDYLVKGWVRVPKIKLHFGLTTEFYHILWSFKTTNEYKMKQRRGNKNWYKWWTLVIGDLVLPSSDWAMSIFSHAELRPTRYSFSHLAHSNICTPLEKHCTTFFCPPSPFPSFILAGTPTMVDVYKTDNLFVGVFKYLELVLMLRSEKYWFTHYRIYQKFWVLQTNAHDDHGASSLWFSPHAVYSARINP